MDNKFIINNMKVRVMKRLQGLEYGYDLPEITDLKQLEYVV